MYLLGLGNKIQYSIAHSVSALAGVIYDIMFNINNDTMFSNASDLIGDSVRSLIGVFMLFRIVVSLLNYLVNPDAATDKSTGGGKLLGRIMITFALLLLSNLFIFDELKDLQNAIVKPDEVGKTAAIYSIFGLNYENSDDIDELTFCTAKYKSDCIYSCAYTQGADFSYTIFTPFLDYTDESAEAQDSVEMRKSFYNSSKCYNSNSSEDYETSAERQEKKAKKNLKKAAKNENFDVDFITSLLMSLIAIVMIAIMCIDVVVRNLKILVLEAISPVTICCYINPKDKIFNTWLKNYGSVYADLFVKLIALRLMSILISYVNNVSVGLNAFEKLFYIMGIIVFAKALPGFISKIFGIEGAGSFKESAGMLKKGLGFGAGAAAGLVAGGVSRAKAAYQGVRNRNDNNGKGRALGAALVSGVSGAFSGATRGAGAGFSGGGRGVRNAVNSQIASSNRLGNQMSQGSTFLGRTASSILSPFGLDAVGRAEVKKQKLEEQNKELEEAQKVKKDINSIADSGSNGKDVINAQAQGLIDDKTHKRAVNNIVNTNIAEHSARMQIAQRLRKEGKNEEEINNYLTDPSHAQEIKNQETWNLVENLKMEDGNTVFDYLYQTDQNFQNSINNTQLQQDEVDKLNFEADEKGLIDPIERANFINRRTEEVKLSKFISNNGSSYFDAVIGEANTIKDKNGATITTITADVGDTKKFVKVIEDSKIKFETSSDRKDAANKAGVYDSAVNLYSYDDIKSADSAYADQNTENYLEIQRIISSKEYKEAQVNKAANEENKNNK